jgi:hypothetical protein
MISLSINFVAVFILLGLTYSVELSKVQPRDEISFFSSNADSRRTRCLKVLRGGGIELPGGLQYLGPILQRLAQDTYSVDDYDSSSRPRRPAPQQSAFSDTLEQPRSGLHAPKNDDNDKRAASGNTPAEEEESEINVEPLGYKVCLEVRFPQYCQLRPIISRPILSPTATCTPVYNQPPAVSIFAS